MTNLPPLQAETPLDIADEDVLDMLKEYYDRSPAMSRPVVPGMEKFLKPVLPDRATLQPIMKGSRKLRENKENEPEKLSKVITEPKKEVSVSELFKEFNLHVCNLYNVFAVYCSESDHPVLQAVPAPKSRGRFEPAAAVENKPGPANNRNRAPEKDTPAAAAEPAEPKRTWAAKRVPPPAVVEPVTPVRETFHYFTT